MFDSHELPHSIISCVPTHAIAHTYSAPALPRSRALHSGNTEVVAGYVAAETGLEMVDIGDLDGATVGGFDGLIVGAPTWHTDADTERSGTAWDDFIYGDLTSVDMKGKKVAIFGLGDSSGYSDNVSRCMQFEAHPRSRLSSHLFGCQSLVYLTRPLAICCATVLRRHGRAC